MSPVKPYRKDGMVGSLRQMVFELLSENPRLKAKQICRTLGIPYMLNRNYVWKLCSEYRNMVRNSRVLNVTNLSPVGCHYGWFWVYLPRGVHRKSALANGWRGPLGKNRFLLFVDSEFGSVRWFETDRVSIRVKVPVNYGRAMTLFNLAFGCLLSPEQLMACHDCIRFKGADYVFEIPGVKLPKFRIRMLRKSNGVEIFSDSSHKGKLEVRVFRPDYAEKSEETIKKTMEMIEAFQNLLRNMIGQNYVKPDTGLGRV